MANFDGNISTEISLSRILDEMIVDGTDLAVVIKFLHLHEKDIPDMFQDSAFVFDLYDFSNISSLDPFLVKHMADLPAIDCYFAMNLYASMKGKSVHALPELEAAVDRVRSDNLFLFEEKWGMKCPWEVLNGDISLWAYVNGIKDERDMRSFVRNSCAGRSLFMARNFLMLSPSAQYLVITQNVVNGVDVGGHWGSAKSLVRQRVYAHMLISLIRQMLVAGNVEMFNWIANVACLHHRDHYFSGKVLDEILMRIPHKSIRDMISPPSWTMPKSTFEEIVFETNMYGGQVDGVDVFLAIYLGGGSQLKGMRENSDLLEFLSLPFDPSEAEMMKEGKC